jgi:hypothetical protein
MRRKIMEKTIKKLMAERCWSYSDLAEKLNSIRSKIGSRPLNEYSVRSMVYYSGGHNTKTIGMLAKVFNVPVGTFTKEG